jgi:hypothetical protein
MKKKSNITKEGFRIRSKKFFLTYPKVIDLPNVKELFLESMQETFGVKMDYLIVKELHKDCTPHIHIYLEFKEKQSIYSRDKLHVKLKDSNEEEIIQEGKYESVRGKGSVIEYILKDFESDYITNMYLPIVSGVIYNTPEEHLLAILKTEGFEAATNVLLTKYEALAANKATTIVRNLRTLNTIILQQNFRKNNSIRDIEEFTMPEEVLHWKTNLHNKKTLILYGPSGTGKTEFCKSSFKSMNFETFLVRDINALGNIQIGENLALLFDDISLASRTREEKIHFFDLENNSPLRILYSVVVIPAGTPRAFTTNTGC